MIWIHWTCIAVAFVYGQASVHLPCACCSAPAGRILVLDESNFREQLRYHEILLVKFVTPSSKNGAISWDIPLAHMVISYCGAIRRIIGFHGDLLMWSNQRGHSIDSDGDLLMWSNQRGHSIDSDGDLLMWSNQRGHSIDSDGDLLMWSNQRGHSIDSDGDLLMWSNQRGHSIDSDGDLLMWSNQRGHSIGSHGDLLMWSNQRGYSIGSHGDLLMWSNQRGYSIDSHGDLLMWSNQKDHWCGECMRLVPEFQEAAMRLEGTGVLAKVDCMVTPQICKTHGISSYPTLKVFHEGEESGTYQGSHTASAIVRYVRKEANPGSQEIRRPAELETFTKVPEAGIVGFFADRRNPNLPRFLQVESALEVYRFAFSCVEDLLQRYAIDKEGIVLFRPSHLHSKFENSTVAFKGTISVAQIKKFIQKNIFGLCPIMTLENQGLLREKDLMVAFYNVDYIKNPRVSSYWRNRVMMVAKRFRDAGEKLNFAIASQQEFSFELLEYGIQNGSGELPAVVIRTTKGHKYVMREDFTRDGQALERFLLQYFSGRLKRYFRSQPIPEKNESAVQIIVADTFNAIVNNREKDVMINFYAPWCGLCQSLEPKYKDVADQLLHDPHMIIAKMDATANDVPPPYEITGFPTIYFVPMESKHAPTLYEGDWRSKDILSFLQKKSTYDLVFRDSEKRGRKNEL
ncbi:protein disulfide-isomerase A3-like [Pelodytes ibericus]